MRRDTSCRPEILYLMVRYTQLGYFLFKKSDSFTIKESRVDCRSYLVVYATSEEQTQTFKRFCAATLCTGNILILLIRGFYIKTHPVQKWKKYGKALWIRSARVQSRSKSEIPSRSDCLQKLLLKCGLAAGKNNTVEETSPFVQKGKDIRPVHL